jgi:cyanophycinase
VRRAASTALALLAMLCLLQTGALPQGSVLLVGGGSEEYNDWSDRPYRWFVEHAPNRRMLILHYATTSSWLPGYFRWLGADSALSLAIPTTDAANDSAIRAAILGFDGIFLRGGDQWEYVRHWKGTLAADAIRSVFLRGGVVGGTSAGLAVLTEPAFDARTTSVNPRTALQSPLSSGMTFTTGFLGLVPGVLGDTHFFERGRMGRLAPMIAVYRVSGGGVVAGAGVDYNTALAVGPDGMAEVMGAGTVTLIRITPATSTTVAPVTPFSAANMAFDQLTDGFAVNLATWEITPPADALPFSPIVSGPPATRVVVDGSASPAHWSLPAGSLATFLAPIGEGSAICVMTSPASGSIGSTVAGELSARGYQPRVLLLNGEASRRPGAADTLASSQGFILVGNSEDSLAAFLSASTPVGRSFAAAIASQTPVLALGNDGKLVSREAVGGVESHEYAAYYGMMRRIPGLGLMSDLHVMTRLFESSPFIDNRASGLFWGMAGAGQPFGVLIDNGTHLEILPDGTLRALGATPVMLIDAQRATTVAFPRWRDPGRSEPRQNAALLGAQLHVLASGQTFRLPAPQAVSGGTSPLPRQAVLLAPYPNPFNARSTITILLPERMRCRITVHDILGRQVDVLSDDDGLGPGPVSRTWDAGAAASGLYFIRFTAQGTGATVPVHLLR